MIGTKLAHYEVTGQPGAGGMGEVYEALDLKLGRRVAIKVLPGAFTHDPDRVARLQREARVLAALNTAFALHPDGERVAVAALPEGPPAARDKVSFVFNFFDELRRVALPKK